MTIANVLNYVRRVCFIFCIFVMITSENSYAGFDTIYFSANGDTTATSFTQGDDIGFGSNCNVGATILWEVWFDYNNNSTIDPLTDGIVMSEHFTDGSLYSEGDPTPDGSLYLGPFTFGPPAGSMIFKATDMATDSSLQMIITVNSMALPPNQFTGQISLPGVVPPNAILQNRPIVCQSETGDEGTFIGLTDINGNYSINIGSNGTGIEFYLEATDFDGYIAPLSGYLTATANGVVSNNNFSFSQAVDSVYGFVRNGFGDVLDYETDIDLRNMSTNKSTTTRNGRYVFYFSEAEKGDWRLRHDSRNLPIALDPGEIEFSHDTLTSFQHDFTLLEPNAFITVTINENGGNPSNNYLLLAYSGLLNVSSEAVSGTGTDNSIQLPVSSLDPSSWSVQIATWDNDFPIPYGLTVQGGNYQFPVSAGGSVNFNLVDGISVSGTFTQDAGDAPIDLSIVNIGGASGSATVNPDGSYELFTTTGNQYLYPYVDGYITNPEYINVNVVGPTSGQDFIINQAHSTVSGTLNNVPLPLDASWFTVVAYTGTNPEDGYYVSAQVDSTTGTYSFDLSDGTWIIQPPCCFLGVNQPDSAVVVIGEAPSDPTKTVDFTYTSSGCCVGIRGNVNNDPGQSIDISDLVYLVDFMFRGGPDPVCMDEANVTGDPDTVDITELVYFVDFMFFAGPEPIACP